MSDGEHQEIGFEENDGPRSPSPVSESGEIIRSVPASPSEGEPEGPRSPSPLSEARSASNSPLRPDSPVGEIRDLYENDEEDAKSEAAGNQTPSSRGSPKPNENKAASASPADRSGASSPVERSEAKSSKRAIVMDSDEEDDNNSEAAGPSRKRALIDSDESDNEGKSKKRIFGSDGSDDEDNGVKPSLGKQVFGDDSDDDDDESNKKANRGAGDGEDDEFADKDDGEEHGDAPKAQSDDDDDVLENDRRNRDGDDGRFEWDFDVMLREKKAERKKKVRRGKDGGIDIINDDDGTISHLVEKMKHAAKADRNANVERKPAFQKIKLLPEVKSMLLRAGIVEALIENGFMSAISEWLAPLPDKCLPALDIRITVLKLLHNPRFWKLDRSTLKQSGLGKAVMLLYKHPNETKENKMIANKLIGEWARPIFQLDTDYSAMTKEERVVMDYDRMPEVKKKKMNINRLREDADDDEDPREKRRPQMKEHADIGPTSSGQLKPGDKGYINRARVPKPSTKDYVVRPKWNIEGECKDRKATGTRRYDQAFRDFQERTKKSKAARAVTVSLEGRNLQI